MKNAQFMTQKPFPGLVAGGKYDYLKTWLFLKNMGKLGLFWSEIEC